MIRYGRTVIRVQDVAKLHDLSMTAFTGLRGRRPPWDDEAYPDPANLDPLAEDPKDRVPPRTPLFDEDQAKAYAAGKPIPPLPVQDHPKDLLTERDAAAYRQESLEDFRAHVKSLRVPEADEKVLGVLHWRRETLDWFGTAPGRNGAWRGQPAADNRVPRFVASERMQTVIDSLEPGVSVTATELAMKTDVAYATAKRFLDKLRPRSRSLPKRQRKNTNRQSGNK
ncbi:hypothetical protein D5S17_35640 [Pseudonocardiaceae bacterium YIM PH 21723]|nr:hypothetical protein D5S17_35640 [Pseudonocardiaceae bacterium YIM PH 21723]